MEESCILTYKKPQKLRLLKSNIPPSQVKSTVILLLLTSTSIYCFRIYFCVLIVCIYQIITFFCLHVKNID